MPRQIGWSQESNILYNISMQLDRLAAVTAASAGGGGTITGGGAAGQITFWNGATSITGSNNLFWDNVNKRMGIGTNTPLTTAANYTVLALNNITGGVLEFQSNGTRIATINNNSLQLDIETKIAGPITFGTNGSERMRIDSVGNVGIGTNSPAVRLHLAGTSHVGAATTMLIQPSGANPYISTSGANQFQLRCDSGIGFANAAGTTVWVNLFNNGNFVIGSNSDTGQKLQVNGTSVFYNAVTFSAGQITFSPSSTVVVDRTTIQLFRDGVNVGNTISSGGSYVNFTYNAVNNNDYTSIGVLPTINQGVFTGITRGIYITPTLTAAFSWRSIEWNNNTGWGLYGAGTAPNYLGGDLIIAGKLALTVVANRQTVNYSLVLADNGKLVEMNVGAANTITVPPNSSIAFPIGTKIDIAQYGAGQTSIVPGLGVTVRSALGALKLAAQYSGASLVKIGTDEWYLFGDITV